MKVYITDKQSVGTLTLMVGGRDVSEEFIREHSNDTYKTGSMSASEFYLWEDRLFREQRILDAGGGEPYPEEGIEESQDRRERSLQQGL